MFSDDTPYTSYVIQRVLRVHIVLKSIFAQSILGINLVILTLAALYPRITLKDHFEGL